METMEFLDMMSHMDPVETMMRSRKPRSLAEAGKTEDAIAYAMAEGFRMGWEAHKKKMEEKTSQGV